LYICKARTRKNNPGAGIREEVREKEGKERRRGGWRRGDANSDKTILPRLYQFES